jgi:hypothetical protein
LSLTTLIVDFAGPRLVTGWITGQNLRATGGLLL